MSGPPALAEPSLGDLLGLALSGQLPAEPEPEPEPDFSQLRAAEELSRQLAPLLRVGEADVFRELTFVPDSWLSLLDTPDGWEILAGHVAGELGAPLVTYRPTIH